MFNANDYTTRQLLEMEFQNVPNSTQKENMIAEALQLVEEGTYTVGEAANEVKVAIVLNEGIPFDNEPGKIRDMKKTSKKIF